jgi:hypothetical protein
MTTDYTHFLLLRLLIINIIRDPVDNSVSTIANQSGIDTTKRFVNIVPELIPSDIIK